jgi:hypothetical protein
MGPGGRVERANKRLGKAVSKLPASRDTPMERDKKMANIDKTNTKVAKRVDKLTKVVGKAADKAVKKGAVKGVNKRNETAMDMVNRRVGEMQKTNPMSGPFQQAIKKRK